MFAIRGVNRALCAECSTRVVHMHLHVYAFKFVYLCTIDIVYNDNHDVKPLLRVLAIVCKIENIYRLLHTLPTRRDVGKNSSTSLQA